MAVFGVITSVLFYAIELDLVHQDISSTCGVGKYISFSGNTVSEIIFFHGFGRGVKLNDMT